MARDSVVSETQGKEENSPVKKGRKKFLIIGTALFLLLAGGASVLYFFPILSGEAEPEGAKTQGKAHKEKTAEKAGRLYPLDAFIVNLADAEASRYLKLKMEMGSNGAMAEGEMEKRLPQLRDAIITLLSTKTYKEICDSEGKKKLKEEILHKADQLWPGFKFEKVYFTEFVVQ